MPKKDAPIRLSPTSGLNLFRECPRCFWRHFNEGIHRPKGPFPSLPGGMDSVLRDYYAKFAGSLPPEIKGKVEGALVKNRDMIGKRLYYRDDKLDAELFGMLDECLLDGDVYIPLDFKTRRGAPKNGASEEYYQTQLDTYALLLQSQGLKVSDFAYLVYYFPDAVENEGLFRFHCEVVRVGIDPERARSIFEHAVACLKGPRPQQHSKCAFCGWGNACQGLTHFSPPRNNSSLKRESLKDSGER